LTEFKIKKFPIWSVDVEDVAGATTGIFKVLADAGADIKFALGRPRNDKRDEAVLFLAPIEGPEQEAAARKAGMEFRKDVVGVQVDGPNRKGGNFKLTAALAHANVGVRALVTTVNGDSFTAVFAMNNDADATKVIKLLHQVLD
jgi:hypothetical protein